MLGKGLTLLTYILKVLDLSLSIYTSALASELFYSHYSLIHYAITNCQKGPQYSSLISSRNMACLDYHGIDHTIAYNFSLSEFNRVKGRHYSSSYIHLYRWSSNQTFAVNRVHFEVP